MLWHDHVPDDTKPVVTPCPFQRALENDTRQGCAEFGLTPIATEGDEVEVPGLLISVQV
jgi:hypothetical protein